MRPSDLQLDTDTWAGPFDLLCTMLLRRELEPGDVRLAEIVVAYVQQLAVQRRIDADAASEFLLLVASLLDIKTRELLAVDEVEVEEPASAEAQAELLARLVQYETFRTAATWLEGAAPGRRWWRVASMRRSRPRRLVEPAALDAELLRRAIQVLLSAPDVDVRHLVGRHATVHEMTGRLLVLLRERRRVRFDEVAAGLSRLDQAVAFVAALELCKHGQVQLEQAEPFGPIVVCHADPVPDILAASIVEEPRVQQVQTA